MGERLAEVDWLDNTTRSAAIEKWRYIAANVAYDTDWESFDDIIVTSSLFKNNVAAYSHRRGKFGYDVLDQPCNRYAFPLSVDVRISQSSIIIITRHTCCCAILITRIFMYVLLPCQIGA